MRQRSAPILNGERGFAAACAALVTAMVAASGFVASREWFSGDDFAFLALVQRPDVWSWRDAYLPLGERFWPFYRPLGMQTYFRLAVAAFGLSAPGFFAVSLAVHFTCGLVVYRLARQLGCDTHAAVAAGMLGVAGAASLGEIYQGTIFHYVAASLASALCVAWFLSALRGGGGVARWGAWLALVAALLCNESAVVLPALLFAVALFEAGFALTASAWLRAARQIAPFAVTTGAYLVLRFGVLAATGDRVLYTQALDAHSLLIAVAQLEIACRGASGLLALAALCLAGGVAALRSGAGASATARGALLCAIWIALALAPFVVLPFPQRRFSIPLETPLALLAALALTALGRAFAPARRPRLAWAFLLLPLLAFPWRPLWERAQHPDGELPLRLVAFVEGQMARLEPTSRLVVLYGVEGLADRAAGERLRYLTYNGGVLKAVRPQTRMNVFFQDLNQRPPRNVLRHDAFYVALLPDLRFAPATASLLDRELPRSLAGGDGAEADE